jgi:Uri superfamily endonuclease
MHLTHPLTLKIGRLGDHTFPAATYVYAGSACGPGGLAARIERHLRLNKPMHWHVDYLRPYVNVSCVFYSSAAQRLECTWSQALNQLPGTFIPVARFGASDCTTGCPAHLIGLPALITPEQITSALGRSTCVRIQT